MSPTTIRDLLLRDLRALRREVEAYPDDDALWRVAPGTRNAGGTLVLHLAGNLRHFVGAVLGGDDYVRDREAEFGAKGLSRARLVEEIDAAARVVDATLTRLPAARLEEAYPVAVGGATLSVERFLAHLTTHLAFHLGQVDYHRRATTGDGRTVGTVAVAELAPRPDPAEPGGEAD